MHLLSLDSIKKGTVDEIIAIIVSAATAAQSAAVNTAKGIIALVDLTGSEAAAKAAMKKAKISDCTVKNAMQLVWAYDEVVRPGHADEKWFDGLLAYHAIEVRRAIAKVGIVKVCEAKLFAKTAKANLVEFSLLADTGLNRAERIAADEVKAVADAAAEVAKVKAKVEAPAVETPPATDSPPATVEAVLGLETAKAGKGKKTVLAEFDLLVGGVEKFVAAIVPSADDVTVETMKQRVTALMVLLDAAATARETVKKTAKAA